MQYGGASSFLQFPGQSGAGLRRSGLAIRLNLVAEKNNYRGDLWIESEYCSKSWLCFFNKLLILSCYFCLGFSLKKDYYGSAYLWCH